MPETSLDFAYPWWLNYGHLTVALVMAVAFVVARAARWPGWIQGGIGILLAWAIAGAAIMWSFGAARVPSLPTEAFLRQGTGRVLDIGAGTGRSSIMVLKERPGTTLVALDLFGDSFAQHFGPGDRPEERLMGNLRAAGVDARATILAGDMRKLPLSGASVDAAVSAYAMDHVGRDGAAQALAEAHRVLKPGGEFLLMLVANDVWMKIAFGPILSHGGTRGAAWWREQAEAGRFEVLEEGSQPGTLFLLLRKPLMEG